MFRFGGEVEFHVERAGDRVFTVGWDLAETEAAIQGDCVLHGGLDGIEAHALITDMPCLADQVLGQCAAQPFAAKVGAQVKPLHLTDRGLEAYARRCSLRVGRRIPRAAADR